MRLYLEATEITTELVAPDFIRVDVTEMTQAEQDAVKAALEDLMAGVPHTTKLHTCYHDKGGPCKVVTA